MVDPLTPHFRASVSQNSLSGGLQQLLQSGSQRGLVQHSNDGKVFVNIKGFALPLPANQTALSSGQAVTVRLQNGQIFVEPVISKTTAAPELNTEATRTISSILSQLGIDTPQAQTVAQAMVQNNIPLNTTVIQELAQTFPQINPETLQSLIFLISRRLPISDAMLYWFIRLTSRRENTGKLTQAVIEDMDGLREQLASQDDEVIQQIHSNLGGFQDQLHQQFLAFQQTASSELEDELKHAVQNALVSAEAVLLNFVENRTALAETVVRLLAYLMELQQQLEQTPHVPLLHDLTEKVEALQEALTAQSLQLLPQVDGHELPSIFVKIPVWKDDGAGEMELLYKPSGSDSRSGSVDLRIEMSNLGPVQIHIGWQHPNLNLGLMVQHQEVKEFLQEHQHVLQDGLSQLGFQIRQIHVQQAQIPSTIQPEIHHSLHTNLSGIDLRI